MTRIHAFEFIDLPWVPNIFRDGATDYLDFFFDQIGFYKKENEAFSIFIREKQIQSITDIASGGGGGILSLYPLLQNDISIQLSDKYPNEQCITKIIQKKLPNVQYLSTPIDGMSTEDLSRITTDICTMFGALHHYTPQQVELLLTNVAEQQKTIAIVDVTANDMLRKIPKALLIFPWILNMLVLFLFTWIFTPFLRPITWWRLLFTYVLPIIPLVIAWDGTVSALRAYSAVDIQAIFDKISNRYPQYSLHIETSDKAILIIVSPISYKK